jgi:hypothetical protein
VAFHELKRADAVSWLRCQSSTARCLCACFGFAIFLFLTLGATAAETKRVLSAAVLDLSWVHDELAPHYSDIGRPAMQEESCL